MSYHPDPFVKNQTGSVREDNLRRWRFIQPFLESTRPEMIYDFGCADGYFALLAAQAGHGVIALDFKQEAIDKAKEFMGKRELDCSFYVYDFASDPDSVVKDMVQDSTVFLLSVMHHVVEQKGIAEAGKVLSALTVRASQLFFDIGMITETPNEFMTWHKHLPDAWRQNPKQMLMQWVFDNTHFFNIDIVGSTEVHGAKRYLLRAHNDELATLFQVKRADGALIGYRIYDRYRKEEGSKGQLVDRVDGSWFYGLEPSKKYYHCKDYFGQSLWVKEYLHNPDYTEEPEELAELEMRKAKFINQQAPELADVSALPVMRHKNILFYSYFGHWPNLLEEPFTGDKKELLKYVDMAIDCMGDLYDLAPNNILHRDGEFRFIDFEKARCNPLQRKQLIEHILSGDTV